MEMLEMNAKIAEYRELCAMAEELDAALDAIEKEFRAEMIARGVDEMRGKDWRATYREIKSSRLDIRGLRAALPDVAAQFTRETTSRRFTIA